MMGCPSLTGMTSGSGTLAAAADRQARRGVRFDQLSRRSGGTRVSREGPKLLAGQQQPQQQQIRR